MFCIWFDLGCKKFTYSKRFSAAPIIATTMQILGNKINKRNNDAFLFLKRNIDCLHFSGWLRAWRVYWGIRLVISLAH